MATKKKRMVWRISDILEAIARDDRRHAPIAWRVVEWLRDDNAIGRPAAGALSVDSVIREHWFLSLPLVFGLPEVKDKAGVEAVSAALVATAKRLGVKQVPA